LIKGGSQTDRLATPSGNHGSIWFNMVRILSFYVTTSESNSSFWFKWFFFVDSNSSYMVKIIHYYEKLSIIVQFSSLDLISIFH